MGIWIRHSNSLSCNVHLMLMRIHKLTNYLPEKASTAPWGFAIQRLQLLASSGHISLCCDQTKPKCCRRDLVHQGLQLPQGMKRDRVNKEEIQAHFGRPQTRRVLSSTPSRSPSSEGIAIRQAVAPLPPTAGRLENRCCLHRVQLHSRGGNLSRDQAG